ncbi:MAG TPA: thiamine phosphate synthase [Desulfovibrio sp.]|uniref:thiamine phosphate synthase n=1 Tax=Desulfovibrio sp. TaxID=885 RepID=UPI002C3843DA|nr:thiamine phosphate synthase [Desulfovibrio sp.]HMM38424.1 thiamine phosphate synthase [Desulfovibrio sp.]
MRPGPDYSLYLVTDRPACLGRDLLDVVALAVRAGTGVVQVREKSCQTREFVELARALKALLDPLGLPLIINDRVDVALAVDAAGVHVGQKDMAASDARALIGPDKLLGLSVNTFEEARAAESLDVDYLGVGPIFPTATKADAGPVFGVDNLARLRASTRRPLVAIGGIGADNAESVAAAGADGLAVVSAICSAPDPGAASSRILAAVRRGRNR